MAQEAAPGITPPGSFRPSDWEARRVIETELAETLFVEASAGTGKTHSLVSRAVNLVAEGWTTLDRVAAITFTEAAAAELRHRIRERLEEEAEATEDGARRERCRQGLSDLDQATIRTLHSFAALLLHERPLEAGLPPGFDTTDEIAAGLKFDDAWETWLDTALESDSPLAQHLAIALTLGLTLPQLKTVARAFHDNYADLSDAGFNPESASVGEAVPAVLARWPEAERLCGFSRLAEEDRLFNHVQGKQAALRRLAEAGPGSVSSLRLLRRALPLKQTRGRQADWETDPVTGVNACKALKDLLEELQEAVVQEVASARRHSLAFILQGLRGFALEYAGQRRAEGRAEFHDLLVWARDMLRDQVEVRDHFRRRFSHLLIDESQDTDPIQAEIAMFLAEDVSEGLPDGDRPRSWEGIVPAPAKLFVVGDPKQSIYRFRRADVQQMRRLQQRMERAGGRTVSLVQNFRSQSPVTDWVNHLFSRWMAEEGSGDGYVQAHYEAMTPRWEARTDSPAAPRVWSLGDEAMAGPMDGIRRAEASDIAALLRQIVSEGWQVLDRGASEEAGREVYRPAVYSDICVLMPARTALPSLERAMEGGNLPYRVESASLVFETQEIRDLLNCLKAIDNPADQVATVAALRSVAFGCSDVELFRHHQAGGRFDCLADHPDTPPGPVSEALSVLRRFHEERLWEPTAALIDRFVRDRELMEASAGHPRMREQWRRYRFMVERAWQFAAAGGGSLRAFIRWVEDQMAEGARVTESPVPESDEESVRVMTVHAAKGLEFPVVVLTGINSQGNRRGDPALFDRANGSVEVGFGSREDRFCTSGFEELREWENLMASAEDVRLMYVAATRARDHLVLSLRRISGTSGENTRAGSISRYLADAAHLWEPVTLTGAGLAEEPQGDDDAADHPENADPDHSIEAWERWQRDRAELAESLSRPSYAAATGLHGPGEEEKPEGETADEPWKRGRAGTSVGRAVHAVLQSIDLSTGEGLEERAHAQAVAEGIPGREADVVRLARVAVESPIVERAVASGRMWREVPVATPIGQGSLQGFIDLLFEEPDGLVVVDYKTDSVSAEEAGEAVARYRLQGGAYAHAVGEITGKPVKEVVFLYLQPQREVGLEDLSQAMREAVDAAEKVLGTGR